MPETKDLSTEKAQAAAFSALDKAATTKIVIEKQADGKWTVTVEP
jgi:hypothetical protein